MALLNWMGEHPILAVILVAIVGSAVDAITNIPDHRTRWLDDCGQCSKPTKSAGLGGEAK